MFKVTKNLKPWILCLHTGSCYQVALFYNIMNKFPKLMNMFICYWLLIRFPSGYLLLTFWFPSLLQTMIQLEAWCFLSKSSPCMESPRSSQVEHDRQVTVESLDLLGETRPFWGKGMCRDHLSLPQVHCEGSRFGQEWKLVKDMSNGCEITVLLTCAKEGQVRDDIYGHLLFQYIGTMHLLSGMCRCRLMGQDESTNLMKHYETLEVRNNFDSSGSRGTGYKGRV